MMSLMRFVAAFLLLVASLAAQKRPISHEDVWLMKRVGPPAVSPDGKWAVASVTEPAYERSKTVSDLWIMLLDGSAPARRLTQSPGSEDGAVFSPDSRQLAFTAKREGDDAPQVYLLPFDGGEARRVTSLSTGASGPKWRPDGKAILFQSRVWPGAASDEENRKRSSEAKARKYNARVYELFPFRYWDRWLDELQPHVFVQSLEEGAKARDLLAGSKLVREPGFDGPHGVSEPDLKPVWSPDGESVVFAATVNRNVEAYAPSTTHLYRVPAAGGEPVPITSGADSYSQPMLDRKSVV